MSLLTNLAAYWKLDATSGNDTDAHGSSTLTASGAPGSAAGKIGNARSFNGSSDYFTCADNADISGGDNDFTLAGWIYSNNEFNNKGILAKGDGGGYEYALTKNAYAFNWNVCSASGYANLTGVNSPSTILPSTWYHVVVWHDSVNNLLGIAVNAGTPDTSAYSLGVWDSTKQFLIGRDETGRYWDGLLDEWGFWRRVLTSTERTELYNGGAGLPYSSFGGAAGNTGVGAAALKKVTSAGAGTTAAGSTGAAAVKKVTAAAAGVVASNPTGVGSPTLKSVLSAGTGTLTASSTAAAAVKKIVAAGTGTTAANATGAAALKKITTAGVGATAAGPNAAGAASLKSVLASGTGAITAGSTGAVSLKSVAAAGLGGVPLLGTAAAALKRITTSAAGVVTAGPDATGSPSLKSVLASGTGTTSADAAGAVSLESVRAAGVARDTTYPDPAECGTDMMAAGAAWFANQLHAFATQPIYYERDGVILSICAALGSTLLKLDDGEGGVWMQRTDRDFIIPASELVIDGQRTRPERGDTVLYNDGVSVHTYAVLPYGGEPPWRWLDPYKRLIRVHTKLVSTE